MGGEYDGVLGDMADLIRGVSYRPDDLLPDGSAGVPLLRATNIGDRRLDLSDVLYVPRGHVRDTQRLRLFDVVIAMSSGSQQAVGRLAQLRQEWDGCVGAFCGVIRPKAESVYPEYLGYVLQSPAFRERIETYAVGTAIMNLSRERILGFPLTLPSTEIQKAIAHILGTLDDKIELNRQMNRTLEEMARAIFKSWFVDFDPVRAKAAVRSAHPSWTNEQVSRAACPNLKPEIAELFPDAFEDSELGQIPKGWKASIVHQHFRLTMGQSPPGSTYNEIGEGVPFYQGRTDFGFRFPTRRVFCTAPTRFAETGDTLVSIRAPVGDVNMANERCAVGRGVAAIRHRSGSRSFTYCSMKYLGKHFDQFEAEGTVFGCINKSDFERLPFVSPEPDILTVFEQIVSPLDDRLETNECQSLILASIRDALLPKLISGELRVKDAEKFVERVAI